MKKNGKPSTSDEEASFLASYRLDKYPRPSVAADIVALTLRSEPTGNWRAPERRRAAILLVKRGGHPFKGSWALPGGFLQPGIAVGKHIHLIRQPQNQYQLGCGNA